MKWMITGFSGLERKCPCCNKVLAYNRKSDLNVASRNNSTCLSCSKKGSKMSMELRKKLSIKMSGDGNPFYGKKHTEESIKLMKLTTRVSGKNHKNWKGGLKHRPDGYIRNSRTDKYIHREVMEKFLGRNLVSSEHVHHKNGNTSDNDIKNLEIFTNSEHRKKECLIAPRDNFGRFCKKC